VTTDSLVPAFEQRPGGPSLTVTVPPSGLIQVAASAFGDAGSGAVSLYEDDAPMEDQGGDLCYGGVGTLFDVSGDLMQATFGTPGNVGGFGCATIGPPGPVLFETEPGEHVYELRYAYTGCSCGTEATFSNRRLWVTTLP
jgi:hypothetical protein